MIRFYFHPTPNPAKIALFLEETGLAYEALPVDTSKGEQHAPAFRAINPNGKVPAIVDTEGPGGNEVRVFDSTAILIYLAEKTGQLLGTSEDRPELLSWLLFIASGLGPFSGQAVHFQFAALGFGALAAGEVAGKDGGGVAIAVMLEGDADFDRNFQPVGGQARHLAQHGLGGEVLELQRLRHIGQKPLQRATQRVVRGALKQRRRRGVEHRDAVVLIDANDGIQRRVDDGL